MPPQDRSRYESTIDPAILAAREARSRYLSDGFAALAGWLRPRSPGVAAEPRPAIRPTAVPRPS